MKKKQSNFYLKLVSQVSLFLVAAFSTSLVFAGGPLDTNIDGKPVKWKTGTINYNPMGVGLKPAGGFDQIKTLQIIDDSFQAWEDIEGVSLNIVQGDLLPSDVLDSENNFNTVFDTELANCYPEVFGPANGPCRNPIFVSEDGQLFDNLFGQCARFNVLGVAGPMLPANDPNENTRTEVKRGWAAVNGACISPTESVDGCNSCPFTAKESNVRATMMHELGHFLGVHHVMLNQEEFVSGINDPGSFTEDKTAHFPEMFPTSLPNGLDPAGLHKDDHETFKKLYGTANNNTCSVTGKVFASDGATELRGAEVRATNVKSNIQFTDAVAYVSGTEAPRVDRNALNQGNCVKDCGSYELTGLTPGETYQICALKILSIFSQGSRLPPIDPPFQTFTGTCPAELTVTCECTGNGDCGEIQNVDIVTDADPDDIEKTGSSGSSDSSGGCSLYQPKTIKVWTALQNTLIKYQ